MSKGFEQSAATGVGRPQSLEKSAAAAQQPTFEQEAVTRSDFPPPRFDQPEPEKSLAEIDKDWDKIAVDHEYAGARKKLGPELYDEIRRLQPEDALQHLIGKGAEHLVFDARDPHSIDKLRDVVIKINSHKTLQHAFDRLSHPEMTDAEQLEQMRAEVRERSENKREMRRYFGKEAVPADKTIIRDIPVSRPAVEALLGHKVDLGIDPADPTRSRMPDTVKAWVTIQERVQMPTREDVGLRGYYPESPTREQKLGKDVSPELSYIEGHELLIGKERQTDLEPAEQRKQDIAKVLEMYPYLRDAQSMAANDPSFGKALAEFAQNAVRYARETGKILDFAGRDNMFMKHQGNEWVVRMPDAVLPDMSASMEHLSEAAQELSEGKSFRDRNDANDALNAMNALRVTNALALISGIQDRVQVEGLDKVPAMAWYEELRGEIYPEAHKKEQDKKQAKREAATVPPPRAAQPKAPSVEEEATNVVGKRPDVA